MIQAAIPYPAATVILVRPDQGGYFEVFMNRRPDNMTTYAGVFVFPGGRVEAEDWSERMLNLVHGISPSKAQEILGCNSQPDLCMGYWVAAVRELFEESGIHFFVSREGEPTDRLQQELSGRLTKQREALQQGQIDFPSLLESEKLSCDVSRLIYFFHRVTPEHYAVRFDTRFYLAALPRHQSALEISEEVAESLWIRPNEALERARSGHYRVMPPTLAVLKALAGHNSWVELCDAYRLT